MGTDQICICIAGIEEGNVGVPLVGCHWEASGIVAGDVPRDDVCHHEDLVGMYVCRLLGCVVHVGVDSVKWEDNWRSC
jgi:hypothetical protein